MTKEKVMSFSLKNSNMRAKTIVTRKDKGRQDFQT